MEKLIKGTHKTFIGGCKTIVGVME